MRASPYGRRLYVIDLCSMYFRMEQADASLDGGKLTLFEMCSYNSST